MFNNTEYRKYQPAFVVTLVLTRYCLWVSCVVLLCRPYSFRFLDDSDGSRAGCTLAGGLSKGLCYVNRKLRESPAIQVRVNVTRLW